MDPIIQPPPSDSVLLNSIWQITLVIVTVGPLLIQLVLLIIVPARHKPAAAQAWLLLGFLLPWFAWILYILIGSPKLSRHRRQQQHEIDDVLATRRAQALQQQTFAPLIPERFESFIHLNQQLSGFSAHSGNQIRFITLYDEAFRQIVSEINQARSYVSMMYYALAMDASTEPVFQALERAVQRGVIVRVLYDHLGSRRYPNYRKMLERLRQAGIQAHRMLPIDFFDREFARIDLRNHRKLVVIDGKVGFTGSQNLIDKTYHRKDRLYYEELVVRVHGPTVAQFEAIFTNDWYAETNEILPTPTFSEIPDSPGGVLAQVLPSGPGFAHENNLRLMIALIHTARRKAVITTPYFVPDDALLAAITIAAQRGVQIQLIVSGVADQFLVSRAQRSYYDELLAAGVEIYLFNTPILLHSKNLSIDDDIAMLGSSNMDMRSFQLNQEITLVIYDQETIRDMHTIEQSYLARSTPLDPVRWGKRRFFQRFVQNTARLVSELL